MSAESVNYRQLYRNKSFMLLWGAQFFGQLADRMFTYILMVSAYRLTHTSLGVSLPSLSFGIPAVLFSVLFGVLVDRHRKKNILFLSNLLRALVIIFLPIIFGLNSSMLVIFISGFIVFTISQLFIPAETSAIPMLVQRQHLILANSLFMGTWMLASILGFGLAVPITTLYTIKMTSHIVTFLYILAAIFIALIPLPEIIKKGNRALKTLLRELRTGIRFVIKHRIVFYSMAQIGFGISIIGVMSVLVIGYAEKALHLSPDDFGYLVAISGFGMGVGIAFMSKLLHWFNKVQLIFLGFSIVGLLLVFLGFNTNVLLALIIIFLLGLGNAFINAPAQTLIQERTPPNIRGRVFSVQNLIASLAFTFPPVVAGYFADLYGYTKIFIFLGLLSLIFNLTLFKLKK